MLTPGTRIENYEIVSTLGAGGFGVTYLARDVTLGRFVAIKEYFPEQFAIRESGTILPMSGAEEEFALGRRDFKREARRLARFKHPAIVGVLRFIEANNTDYIVMAFLDGRTLLSWLSEIDATPPTQEELDLIMAPLLDALELVHKNGMLHRDIKLSNIIITHEDGAPVLIDFGAAKEAASIRSKEIGNMLTPPYAPFEQYSTDDEKQGPWSDIYSLSVVIYRCITGVFPPEATSRVQDPEPLPMPTEADGYRAQFLVGLLQGLEIDRRKRPQNVAEWRDTLFSSTALRRIEAQKIETRLSWLFRTMCGYFERKV